MADITTLVGKRDAAPTGGDLITLTPDAAATLAWDGVDERMCVMITTQGVADSTFKVSKGTGIRSTIGDLTMTLTKGKSYALILDSMRFKDMSTGKVSIVSNKADIVALIKL